MSDQARALPDMSVRDALRSPAIIFYTYDVDNGALLRASADLIQALDRDVAWSASHVKERERVWAERERVAVDKAARSTEDLARAIEAGTAEQARADGYRDRLRACAVERIAERAEVERLTALIPDPDDLRTVLDDLKERARVRRLMERDASWPPTRRWLDAYDRLSAALAAEKGDDDAS